MAFALVRAAGKIPRVKCPSCGKLAFLTKEHVAPIFHHVYKCMSCGKSIGCPTQFAWCEKHGVIAKDLVANDCLVCEVPGEQGFDARKEKCPYFDRVLNVSEIEEHLGRLRMKKSAEIVRDAKLDAQQEEEGKK